MARPYPGPIERSVWDADRFGRLSPSIPKYPRAGSAKFVVAVMM
jgi:hypothetical protein